MLLIKHFRCPNSLTSLAKTKLLEVILSETLVLTIYLSSYQRHQIHFENALCYNMALAFIMMIALYNVIVIYIIVMIFSFNVGEIEKVLVKILY